MLIMLHECIDVSQSWFKNDYRISNFTNNVINNLKFFICILFFLYTLSMTLDNYIDLTLIETLLVELRRNIYIFFSVEVGRIYFSSNSRIWLLLHRKSYYLFYVSWCYITRKLSNKNQFVNIKIISCNNN